MRTRWLSDHEQQAWRRFAAVLELLPGVLDSQLSRDQGITHFDYFTLAMLSEAPRRTLRMSALASLTNATLARLSNVVRRLEAKDLVERRPCPEDRRATDVVLTDGGWKAVVESAPGHVETVRSAVFEALSAEQVDQLATISELLLDRLDPDHQVIGHDGGPRRRPLDIGQSRADPAATSAIPYR